MQRDIITIGREYGSGGRLIGRRVAKELNYAFYDKGMIFEEAKNRSGFSQKVLEQVEQYRTRSLLYDMFMTAQELPVNDQIFLVQANIIQELSEQGPCVIVGRCADYILRNKPGCLRVFVHAPMSERIRRVQEDYGEIHKNTDIMIRREDKRRAAYYNHFTQGRWGAAENFHLSVDTSLGLDLVVELIEQAATSS